MQGGAHDRGDLHGDDWRLQRQGDDERRRVDDIHRYGPVSLRRGDYGGRGEDGEPDGVCGSQEGFGGGGGGGKGGGLGNGGGDGGGFGYGDLIESWVDG